MRNKITAVLLICALIIIKGLSVSVEAGTQKNKKDTDSYLFACPGHGWSTITVKVDYTEYIVNHEGKNKYWKRDNFYAYHRDYANNKPKLNMKLSNTKHINKDGKTLHTFKTWTRQSVLADPKKWDFFAYYKNGANVYYKYTTKNKAVVYYSVDCPGATFSYREKSIKMKLNTK